MVEPHVPVRFLNRERNESDSRCSMSYEYDVIPDVNGTELTVPPTSTRGRACARLPGRRSTSGERGAARETELNETGRGHPPRVSTVSLCTRTPPRTVAGVGRHTRARTYEGSGTSVDGISRGHLIDMLLLRRHGILRSMAIAIAAFGTHGHRPNTTVR